MNVNYEGKTYTCRRAMCGAGYMRPGDFVLFQGQMCRVVTVQTDCFSLESLKKFVMVTLQDRRGHVIPARSLTKREVFRPVK